MKIKETNYLKGIVVLGAVFVVCVMLLITIITMGRVEAADGCVYVSDQGGNDLNVGSEQSPKKTIQAAIDAADSQYEIAEVRVAAGSYEITSPIIIKEGISVYGGYSLDFNQRDQSQYITTINNVSLDQGYGGQPKHSIYLGSGITASTVVDGFTIKSGDGKVVACIKVDQNSGGTISNNILESGDASEDTYCVYALSGATTKITGNTLDAGGAANMLAGDFTNSYGIYAFETNLTIEHNNISAGRVADGLSHAIYGENVYNVVAYNMIDGGTCAFDQCYSCAIREDGSGYGTGTSDSDIYNNAIEGGTGYRSYGILVADESNSKIYNNVVTSGPSSWLSIAIYIKNDCDPRIINNIIYVKGADGYCIYENDPGNYSPTPDSNPGILRNNNLFDCNHALLNWFDENTTSHHQVTNLTQSGPTTFDDGAGTLAEWGNISENISDYLDPEYRFTGDLGNFVFDTAGFNGTNPVIPLLPSRSSYYMGFTNDKDSKSRSPLDLTPAGWSVGAYEYDSSLLSSLVFSNRGPVNTDYDLRRSLFVDVDNDGCEDLIAYTTYNPQRFVLLMNKYDTVTGKCLAGFEDETLSRGLYIGNPNSHHMSVFDIDNDGFFDLWTGDAWHNDKKLYINQGVSKPGYFYSSDFFSDDTKGSGAVDVDGDGDIDLLDSGNEDDGGTLYINQGGSLSETYDRFDGGTSHGYQGPVFGDYDNDGDPDMLGIASYYGTNHVYRNNGNGYFTEVTNNYNLVSESDGGAFADFDNDRDLDIVLVNGEFSGGNLEIEIWIYENQNDGFSFVLKFHQVVSSENVDLAYTPDAVMVADFDNDGDLDLWPVGQRGMLLNDGSFNFNLQVNVVPVPINNPSRTASIADPDNDGDIDIFYAQQYYNGNDEDDWLYWYGNDLNPGSDKNWLQVSLTGEQGDAGGYGVRVSIFEAGHANDMNYFKGMRESGSGYMYHASVSRVLHFGGLETGRLYDIVVKKPFGKGEFIVFGVAPGERITVDCANPPNLVPKISLSKTSDRFEARSGEELVYTIEYQNISQTVAVDVVITDQIPTGAAYVVGSADNGGVYSNNQIDWHLDNLEAGASGRVSFKVQIN